MFRVVENERRQQLQWLEFVLRTKRWRVSELARRTGVDASTFSKFKNDPDNRAMMEASTISLIEEASGLRAYETTTSAKSRGLAETESAHYEAEPLEVVDGAVKAMKGERNGIDPWVLRSRCLEAAGYLPGDVMMVDLNMRAEPGDVVCAQVYDRAGRAETVFRIFEDPFLVSATLDRTLFKPLLVDNDRVVLRGVVIASFRERRAA